MQGPRRVRLGGTTRTGSGCPWLARTGQDTRSGGSSHWLRYLLRRGVRIRGTSEASSATLGSQDQPLEPGVRHRPWTGRPRAGGATVFIAYLEAGPVGPAHGSNPDRSGSSAGRTVIRGRRAGRVRDDQLGRGAGAAADHGPVVLGGSCSSIGGTRAAATARMSCGRSRSWCGPRARRSC